MTDSNPDESEDRYRQLIQMSPAPISLFDAAGEIIWGNEAVIDLVGLDSRDELVESSIFEFISPADQYTAKQELAEVVGKKESVGPTTMSLVRADGSERTIRVSTAPGQYRGEDIGQAVIIDVTPLQEAHDELQAQRQFMEDALDTLQDVFYVVNSAGELVRWNDELRKVSGYTDEELRGRHVEDFFVEEDLESVTESVERALDEGSDELEATVRTRDGREIPFEFRKRRLTDGSDVTGVVGIGRDISARRVRDQHIQTVDHLLKHNLRNQANVILAATSLLKSDGVESATTQFEQIERASERLLSIFEDHHYIVNLLTSRDSLEPIDVTHLVEQLVRAMANDRPSATIETECEESVMAIADPMLERAIIELAENAVDHTDEAEPSVTIVVESADSTVTIQVKDHGPEIPEIEYKPLEDGNLISTTFHPTELGLWFVYLVVTKSGGSLSFDRNDPRGNVVTIELDRLDRLPSPS